LVGLNRIQNEPSPILPLRIHQKQSIDYKAILSIRLGREKANNSIKKKIRLSIVATLRSINFIIQNKNNYRVLVDAEQSYIQRAI
jgi:hypothetical protein